MIQCVPHTISESICRSLDLCDWQQGRFQMKLFRPCLDRSCVELHGKQARHQRARLSGAATDTSSQLIAYCLLGARMPARMQRCFAAFILLLLPGILGRLLGNHGMLEQDRMILTAIRLHSGAEYLSCCNRRRSASS